MAKRKKAVKKEIVEQPMFKGTRRAEALSKQLERWTEKWPVNEANAGEWLKFCAVAAASIALLEVRAGKIAGVIRGDVSLMKAVQTKKEEVLSVDED